MRVEPAVRDSVADERIEVLLENRLPAKRPNLGETWVLLNLDAPALILGEVPVKRIHLVHRQEIDVLLDEIDREEVAPHVEVHTPVGKSWSVVDLDGGNRPHCFAAAVRTRRYIVRNKLP